MNNFKFTTESTLKIYYLMTMKQTKKNLWGPFSTIFFSFENAVKNNFCFVLHSHFLCLYNRHILTNLTLKDTFLADNP